MFQAFNAGKDSRVAWEEATEKERPPVDPVPVNERSGLLRPSRERVEYWLERWPRRWAVLVLVPSVVIWIWAAVPFPVSDPYDPHARPPWEWPNATVASTALAKRGDPLIFTNDDGPSGGGNSTLPDVELELPVDANFWFFLFWYFAGYTSYGLLFITKLFDLYRLAWWPERLGFLPTYMLTLLTTIGAGALLHQFDLLGIRGKRDDHHHTDHDAWENDWQRKTLWVGLAFCAMAMPCVACFIKLRKDRRNSYRHSMTATQKTFLEHVLGQRIPRSYLRFLWFLSCLAIALLSLVLGQGYASVYLATLPHSSLDGVAYVWCWIGTVQILNAVTCWILERKVRSRALLFCFRFYFSMTYLSFYRSLFARLKDPSQYITVQLLTSSWIIIWYPLSMTKLVYKLFVLFGYGLTYEEHLDSVAQALFIRNLSENVTMASFLGWLTILHFGPNKDIYPFFAFERKIDPYTYQLTMTASSIIWGSELVAGLISRHVCKFGFGVDVTNVGLDELREFPELVPSLIATSLHVSSDMLLFLVRLNFR